MLDSKQWDTVNSMLHEDVNRLRLANHGKEGMDRAIDQIDCRQRCAKKLAITLTRAPHFVFPSVLSAEQSTSDLLAEYHARLCGNAKRVLDMTCGLGIDSFHIAHHGAEVTACELTEFTARCAAHNAMQLGLNHISVKCCDSVDMVREAQPDSFDCIFVDPARRGSGGKRLFALADCSPDVTVLMKRMLEIAPMVVVKASPMLDVTHTLLELPNVDTILAVGTRRECKELVIICKRHTSEQPTFGSVTLAPSSSANFFFTRDEETSAVPLYEIPVEGSVVYEPFPATVKIGAPNYLATRFGMTKIAPNSHLYVSTVEIPDFPGRAYRVAKVLPFNKQSVKQIHLDGKRLDITTRNFPLSPSELFKKLKVKQGDDFKLFATTTDSGRPILILANPLS